MSEEVSTDVVNSFKRKRKSLKHIMARMDNLLSIDVEAPVATKKKRPLKEHLNEPMPPIYERDGWGDDVEITDEQMMQIYRMKNKLKWRQL